MSSSGIPDLSRCAYLESIRLYTLKNPHHAWPRHHLHFGRTPLLRLLLYGACNSLEHVTCARTSMLWQLTFSCGRPPLTLPSACFETTLTNLSYTWQSERHCRLMSTDAQVPNRGPSPHTPSNLYERASLSSAAVQYVEYAANSPLISKMTHKRKTVRPTFFRAIL